MEGKGQLMGVGSHHVSTMWVLGLELRFSGWIAGVTEPLSHLTGSEPLLLFSRFSELLMRKMSTYGLTLGN